MSTHSYSRCWLHLIWETLRREPILDKDAAARASVNLSEYSTGTDWNGAMRETVETVEGDRDDCGATRLKPGENETSAKNWFTDD